MHQGWKEKSERPSEGGKEATTSPTSTRQEVERCPIICRRRGQAARRFHVDGFRQICSCSGWQFMGLWNYPPVPVVCSPWTSTDSTEALNHKCNDTCLFNKGKPCLMTVTLTNFWSVCDLVGLGVPCCICCCPNRYFIEMFRHIVNVSSRLQLSKNMSVVCCLLYRSCLPNDFNADWMQIGRI